MTRLAAVGGLLLGGAMVAQAAMASETPNSSSLVRSSADEAGRTGTELTKRLGTDRTAGSWIGKDGKPVVAVTDDSAADAVRAAGAEPKMVGHSMNELKAATTTLKEAPRIAGTAWSVDYRTNKVVVQADSTVSADDWSKLTKVASGIGGFVQMERTKGKFTTRLNGALPILSTSGRCSAGFNVTNGQQDFILTAGHCGPNGSIWFSNNQASQEIGQTVESNFPGADYSLVQYANGKAGDGADIVAIGNGNGVKITGFGDPVVGQRVFRSGSTTGLRDGQVTALNSTVNYPEGTVTGLIETNVCAEPGDSGGSMFSEGIALGVTSGGSGDCTSGGTTFFQPVSAALATTKLQLIVAPKADGAQQSGGAPAPAATQAAIAPGSAAPGSTTPVDGIGSTLASKLTDPLAVGPGLMIIAASMGALFFTRYLREERERKEYQRYYSANWS
ncbi:MAG TPA: S1 family peptidase [Streptomyces sp.]